MKSLAPAGPADAALGVLSHFRIEFYDCLYQRADSLFELTDAVLCADGPVTSLVGLTLTAEHRRGHGAMYDAVNHGWLEPRRLCRLLAATPVPRAADGRIVLAVDVSNWLRPDAPTSPDLLFCHVYGRGRGSDQFIPGWLYPFVAALESGRTSWTALRDAIRLGPADDATAVAATQLRDVVPRLIHARQWKPGDADILVVMDAGYDVTRLAFVLADLPVELVGRLRSDRGHAPRRSPSPLHPARRAAPHAWRRPHLLQARLLAHPRPDHRLRHQPLRDGRSPGTGCTHAWPPAARGSTTAANSP
ncbi:transposase [Streptomyces sp. NPDC055400]